MITNDIQFCIDALTRGELVAFPTETVFGLGARADSAIAVSKIFELKKRPTDHPLIIHCADVDIALAVTPYIPDYAKKLAKEFWPGPMTLIFERANSDAICDEAVGGHDTVAIRVPSHETARALLAPCGFFIAAPSANNFGHVSPTIAKHVQDEFGDDLIILDGEQSQCGLESTIISCVSNHPRILRAGAITAQDILRVTGHDVTKQTVEPENEIAASGTLENHYAPNVDMFVVKNENEIELPPGTASLDCAFIAFTQPSQEFKHVLVVKDYSDYAHELYSFLRVAESLGCKAIYAMAPENEGIGIAINDRLLKASRTKDSATG